jgi:hypothetical protein
MSCNMNRFDRNLRILAGIVLITWLMIGGPSWTMVGLYLILTGAWRFCPVYTLFSKKSFKKRKP